MSTTICRCQLNALKSIKANKYLIAFLNIPQMLVIPLYKRKQPYPYTGKVACACRAFDSCNRNSISPNPPVFKITMQ